MSLKSIEPLSALSTCQHLEISKVQIMKAKSLTYSHVAVWEFDAYIASGVAKSQFEAHTAMSWSKFEWEVMKHLDGCYVLIGLHSPCRHVGLLRLLFLSSLHQSLVRYDLAIFE